MSTRPIVIHSAIPKVDDFTAYLREEDALQQITKNRSGLTDLDLETHIAMRYTPDQEEVSAPGDPRRILACSCYGGKFWSLTVRQKGEDGLQDLHNAEVPRSTAFTDTRSAKAPYLNTFSEIYGALYQLIFKEQGAGTTGLVVVTGGTGSGKSNIIRGLIDLYLRDRKNWEEWNRRQRRPHLVTYENPIEQLLIREPCIGPADTWIDYTPRQRGIDVPDLKTATKSALRQTPAAFYVGEVRDMRDWKTLLEFAGTGHLVFVTSHAGSLVEAMGTLFSATRSHTAARRAIVADRLAALVHLRQNRVSIVPDLAEFSRNVTVPSLWRRTMVGAKTLTAEGQSSLLPRTCNRLDKCSAQSVDTLMSSAIERLGGQSSFGRTFFREILWSLAAKRLGNEFKVASPTTATDRVDDFRDQFCRRCTEWDLEGL